MKPQALNLDSEIFDDLRVKFNYVLNLAMRNMQRAGISMAKVTARVDITSEDAGSEGGARNVAARI